MRTIFKLAALAAFAAMPFSAMAATVTQVLNSTGQAPGYGSQGTSYTTKDGFITIESTGGNVWIGSSTMGVESGTVTARHSSVNTGESLRFTFSGLVTDVTFKRNGGTQPGILTSYDENGDEVFRVSADYPYSILSTTVINGPDNTPIKSFLFQGVYGSAAGFTSLTYTKVPMPAPAPVPLPATGLLLMAGVGAMGFVRRKKSLSPVH